MGLARTHSVALTGVAGHLVEVEAHIGSGLPATILVGLSRRARSIAVESAVARQGGGDLSTEMRRRASTKFSLAI